MRLSARLNGVLGLDVPYTPGEETEDPPEHMGQQALLWARKRGLRCVFVRMGAWVHGRMPAGS